MPDPQYGPSQTIQQIVGQVAQGAPGDPVQFDVDVSNPDSIANFVYSAFINSGFGASEARFAVRVGSGESGGFDIGQWGDPVAEPPGGYSHGVWQLYDNGLLPAFYEWAAATGNNADPYDVRSATKFVVSYIASNGPAAWDNWTVARNLMAQGEGPGSSSGQRIQFPSEAALDQAQAAYYQAQAGGVLPVGEQIRQFNIEQQLAQGQFQENKRQNQFERVRDKIQLLQTTDQLRDARREAAVNALINTLPYMVAPGTQYTPGLEPFGAGSALGGLLGANVPPQRMPTAEVPLQQLANAPSSAGGAQGISGAIAPFLDGL